MKKRYVTLLRGINVSGKNKIKMTDFKNNLQSLGFENIKTYIQTGNIVFDTEVIDKDKVSKMVSDNITKNYGYKVPVITIDDDKFIKIIKNNNLIDNKTESLNLFHVTILENNLTNESKLSIEKLKAKKETIHFWENIIYIHCPDGYSRTKLSNNNIEKISKGKATTRNMRTILKIKEILGND